MSLRVVFSYHKLLENFMTEKTRGNSFVKQAAILAGASIFVRFLGFVYRLPLTGMIGDTGNNIYGKAYYIYNFFYILSAAGMPAAISKLVAERVSLGRRDEAHRVFRIALAVSAVFGLLSALVLGFGAGGITNLLDAPRSYNSLIALSPTVLIVSVMAVYRGYFQGLGTTFPTSMSQIVEQVFNAAFSIILAYAFMKITTDDLPALGAAGGTMGTGIGALAGFLFIIAFYYIMKPVVMKDANRDRLHRRTKGKQPSIEIVKEILKTAFPIIAGTAVFSISNLIDVAMVTRRLVAGGFAQEMADVLYGQLNGKYTTIVTFPVSIATALAMAAIPSISSSAAMRDKPAVESKIQTALRLAMLICVPAAAGLCALGKPIVELLFPSHPDGGTLLTVGAVNIVFLALNQILTGPLQATGYMYVPVMAAALGCVIKIALNYVLVANPAINIYGAVIGTMLCYMAASAFNWHMLRKKLGISPSLTNVLLKPLAASVMMGGLCFVIYNVLHFIMGEGYVSNAVSTIIAVIAGVAVYFLLMLMIKGINKRDLRLIPMGGKLVYALEKRRLI